MVTYRQHGPGGSTDLASVLRHAFDRVIIYSNALPLNIDIIFQHFKSNKPETILVITDGEPDDKHAVAR